MSRYLIIFILFLVFNNAYGKEYPMLHYTVEDGLPSNTIYQVYKDSRGYLWFSSDKGIARYNGIKFEKFNTTNGLPDNEIFYFNEDPFGRLWMGTYNGELCFFKDGVIHTSANTPYLKLPFKLPFISNIQIEYDSSVSIQFRNRTKILNIKDERCQIINLVKLDTGGFNNLLFFHKLPHDQYEFSFVGKKYQIDTNCNVLKYSIVDYESGTGMQSIHWLVSNNNIQKYFFNEHFVFNQQMKIIKRLKDNIYSNLYIYCVYGTKNDTFISTDYGIRLNDTISLLADYKVSSLVQDKEDNYWASTLGQGVYRINKYFLNTSLLKNPENHKVVYLYNDSSYIVFTTEKNNIYLLSKNSEQPKLLYQQNQSIRITGKGKTPAYLLTKDYRYYNFFGFNQYTIDNVLAPKPSVKLENSPFKDNEGVKDLTVAGNKLYVNTRSRVVCLDYSYPQKGAIKLITVSDTLTRIYDLQKSADNEIWYNTIKDLYKVEGGKGIVQNQFSNINLKAFAFFGKFLLGYTHSNQMICIYDYNHNFTINYIPSQDCIWDKLYKIDDQHILISTNNLYRLLTLDTTGRKKPELTAIESPYIPLQAEAICLDKEYCYFFKKGVISVLNINSLLIKPNPPKLYFTQMTTGKTNRTIDSIVTIKYNESSNISIAYSTISFGGDNVSYQYSFSDNETDSWREVTGEEVSLVHPGYGQHIIKIRAKTISSDYCQPISFTLIIERPYFATWWFILILSICLVTSIWAIVKFRITKLLRKREREHKLEIRFIKSEFKAMNALMNPHFIFNTLNNVQSLVNNDDKLAANEYLRIFADLIRQNMQNLSKELISLQKEIDLINNYLLLEKLRFEDQLNYAINIDPSIEMNFIMIPPLLIQPLVENSIKHGILPLKNKPGFIQVDINERDNTLVIEVKDNGAGINPGKGDSQSKHESFALENIKKRIAQLGIIQNKEINFEILTVTDSAGNAQWTVAMITIPIS